MSKKDDKKDKKTSKVGSSSKYDDEFYYDDVYDDEEDDDIYTGYTGYRPYSGYTRRSYYKGGDYSAYKSTRTYKKSSYENNFSWSSLNYTWGNQDKKFEKEDEEFDKESFIERADGYQTPSSSSISRRLNTSFGYSSQNNSEENRKFVKELSRFFYHKMMFNDKYVSEKYSDENEDNLNEEELMKKQAYTEFYSNLWETNIQGYSPLEKAIFTIKSLKDDEERKTRSKSMNSDFGESICEKDQEEIEQMLETADSVGGFMDDPDIRQMMDLLEEPYKHMTFEILRNMSILDDFGDKFVVKKEVEEKRVIVSKERRQEKMRSHSDIIHVNKYQRRMPNYKYKLATKDLTVNVPVTRDVNKQKIIMLVDYSGSMDRPNKQQWVLAILIDRLKKVMDGDAEVFFSFFVRGIYGFTHIHDKKSALQFIQHFSTKPSGGDTDIGSVIDKINRDINEYKKLGELDIDLSEEKPEVLIINDGQDSIKTSDFSYKTNAISITQENDELKTLCLNNNGLYVFIDDGGTRSFSTTQDAKNVINYFGK